MKNYRKYKELYEMTALIDGREVRPNDVAVIVRKGHPLLWLNAHDERSGNPVQVALDPKSKKDAGAINEILRRSKAIHTMLTYVHGNRDLQNLYALFTDITNASNRQEFKQEANRIATSLQPLGRRRPPSPFQPVRKARKSNLHSSRVRQSGGAFLQLWYS